MFTKKRTLILVIMLVGILAVGCGSNNTVALPDVVATVNGFDIGKEVYEDRVDRMKQNYEWQGIVFEGEEGEAFLAQITEMAIESLIEEEAILQEALSQGLLVPDERVAEELDEIKDSFESEEEFQNALTQSNYTIESFTELISRELLFEMFIDNNIEEASVSEEEIMEVYNEYKEAVGLQAEEAGEEPEILPLEDVKEEIEIEIKQQKQHMQLYDLIDEIMENSQIEKFI